MPETMEKAVRKAIMETFEEMAFMEVYSHPAEAEAKTESPADLQEVYLDVLEPLKGTFRLALPKALLAGIAENVFAIPAEELNEQIFQDTLAELLNTIAGQILQEVLTKEQTFALGLPQKEKAALETSCSEKTWRFQTEDHSFYLAYAGQEKPSAG